MTALFFALDTSCMAAVVCGWHERHAAAAAEIERLLGRGERLVFLAQALAETYAVLTQLPPPHRLSTKDAWAVLETNLVARRSIVALDTAPTGRSFAAWRQKMWVADEPTTR